MRNPSAPAPLSARQSGVDAYHPVMSNSVLSRVSKTTAGTRRPAGGATEPAARVLRRFRLVFNAVKTHFQQVEKKAGVGGAQLWALSVIRECPGIGVNGLARAMDIHQTTASNLVKALAALELVSVEKNGPDRRAVQLRVVAAGGRVLRKAPGPFAGVLPEALSRLDAKTLERMDRDLAKLLAELRADERAAGIPLAQM
jgi:DNA-binding MarR family transcriptional regulator